MTGSVPKENNPINRVKCSVNSCYYYQNGDHCTAQHIEIQPMNASTSQITDCSTFAHK